MFELGQYNILTDTFRKPFFFIFFVEAITFQQKL